MSKKKTRRKRRFFSDEGKSRLLSEYDSLNSRTEKQAFRNRHGLSTYHLSQWRAAGYGDVPANATEPVFPRQRPIDTEEGSAALQSALEFLRSEASRIKGQYQAAKATARNLKSEITRVQKAIAALIGEKSRSGSRAPAKDSPPTGDELASFMERLLIEHGPLKEPDLRAKLSELLEAEGRPRKGTHFTFKAALRDERFLWNGVRWTLRKNQVKQSG